MTNHAAMCAQQARVHPLTKATELRGTSPPWKGVQTSSIEPLKNTGLSGCTTSASTPGSRGDVRTPFDNMRSTRLRHVSSSKRPLFPAITEVLHIHKRRHTGPGVSVLA